MGKEKHGYRKRHLKNKLYNVWRRMKSCCLNMKNASYKSYGGRGIIVCKEWLEYLPFHKWAMANGYAEGLTIERINNSGNYSPENCTWIPPGQQARNRRTNKIIAYNGKSMLMIDWSKKIGISKGALCKRFLRGWNVEKALNTPLQTKGKSVANGNKNISIIKQGQ